MSYRDDAAHVAKADQLQVQLDEAVARGDKLEAELTEARTWLKNRPASPRPLTVVSWVGLGSLGGSFIGTGVWCALDNPFFLPLATLLGAVLTGVAALMRSDDDGVGPPPPPRMHF